MKCKIPYYKSNQIFGDDLFHRIVLSDYKLSTVHPDALIIGVTTTLPSQGSTLKSEWLWRYNFSSATYDNFWSSASSYGANGSSFPTGIQQNVNYNAGGDTISGVYVTSGWSDITKFKSQFIRMRSYNDWYFTSMSSYPSDYTKRAIIISFTDGRQFDLPADLYTISGNSITWNMNHALMPLLQGAYCYIS